jgi:SAM-dependent methyltransferase
MPQLTRVPSLKTATVGLLRRAGLLRPLLSLSHSVKAMRSRDHGRPAVAPDGLPVPDPRRIVAVNGNPDVAAFLASGALGAATVRDTLARNGLPIERMGAILDFGCGCGRVIRHWNGLAGTAVHGTDYNRDLIAWCRDHLSFARFGTNQLRPPLDYPDATFDLVYAFSVFTHLTGEMQRPWLDELMRVIRPGGHLLFSTHGDFYIPSLRPDERDAFAQGRLVVRYEDAAGTNLCATFHPRSYVERELLSGLTVVDMIPEGARGNPRQDLYLVRRS